MIFIFDTSSFVSMARYYQPFDLKRKTYHHVKTSIENGRIILIDAVLDECRYVGNGVVIEKLDFLDDKTYLKTNNNPIKTDDIIPVSPSKFYNMVDHNFATPRKRTLNTTEYESEKQAYLDSADAKMVMYARNYNHYHPDTEIVIVTEETGKANDNKTFKKLPEICKQLSISTMTLPEYLNTCKDLDISIL